ncbi:unnamed protein product [Symbiodinium sp. CCMP2592]|nr:unnamed protein product [Symbiodinium sp. CCMP2592]
MAKRRFKLLALALSIMVARSFVAPLETSRITQVGRHKAPRITRWAFDASNAAQYLEPFVAVLGLSLKDVVQGVQVANSNIVSLSRQDTLVNSDDAQDHAESLAEALLAESASPDFRNIFLPKISLPRIPVNGTKFQLLVSSVLSDTNFTGASSIHAEPGVGKSVAAALAMLEWAKYAPRSITVLFSGSVARLKEFFKVEDITLVPVVAGFLYPILAEEGVRLQLILDNIFDTDLAEGKMVMDLAKAAFQHGQIIVITQSEMVAKGVAKLNGLRTRLAPQQQDAKEYRWSETQALQLFAGLEAANGVKSSDTEQIEDAVKKSVEKFKTNPVMIAENLDGARFPDGGWSPVGIIQFQRSGQQPVSAAGSTSASTVVWVRELIRKDGTVAAKSRQEGEDKLEPAFKVSPKDHPDARLNDVDDLKKAIKQTKSNALRDVDPDQIDIYLRSKEAGGWQLVEDESEVLRQDSTRQDCYGFLPRRT